MKKLIIILFVFLLACSNTPENKIRKSFENQKFMRYKHMPIKKIEIYDTLTAYDIINTLNFLDDKIQQLQIKLTNIDKYKDSVNSIYPRIKRDSSLRGLEHKQNFYEREFDITLKQQLDYANLGKQIDDSIYAYKVKITTDRVPFYFLVSPITFDIITPTIPPMTDSLKNFNKF